MKTASNPRLSALVDLKALNKHGPITFQDQLFELVDKEQPKVIVETGTRRGVSTILMLVAAPKGAHIYSCDPMHNGQAQAAERIKRATGFVLPSSAWTFYPEVSHKALPKVPTDPAWDLFVHDSDHSEAVVNFELRFAWERLRQGGYLVCDDWDTVKHARRKHSAFVDFCAEVGVTFEKMGSAAVIRKP